MSKTVSAKIPNQMHEELRERCNRLGCTINEFIENSIDFGLNESSDFDFGNDAEPENEPKSEPIQEEKPTSEVTNVRIID